MDVPPRNQTMDDAERCRQLEQALRDCEERFRTILNASLDAVISIDTAGRVLEWNAQAEQIFGWPREAVLGQPLADLILPEPYREAHRDGLQRYLATGEGPVLNGRIEVTALRRDGTEFPVELAVAPARFGETVLFNAFVRDITERQRAQHQLARQALESRLLHESTRLAAEAASFEEVLRGCVQLFCELLDWRVGHVYLPDAEGTQLLPTSIWSLREPTDEEFRSVTTTTYLRPGEGLPGRVFQSGEPCWINDIHKDANYPRFGICRHLDLKGAFGFPIKRGEQVVAVLEFFSSDELQPDPDLVALVRTVGEQVGRVVERKQAQAALQQSEERLRLAMQAGRMGSWDWDIRTNAVSWSPGLERIHGLQPGTFPGTFVAYQQDIHPDDRERVLQSIAETVRSDCDHHLEYRIVWPDGSVHWIEARGQLLRDENGQPVRMVGVCMDIDQRKESEERLRQEMRVTETLNRVGRMLAGELDPDRLMQTVTDEATALTGAEFGAFFYNAVNEQGESYVLYTLSGASRERFADVPMPRNTELFAPTFRGEGILRLDDVTRDPRFGRNPPFHGLPEGHLPVRSYLAVPVVSRSGEVLGGLFLGSSQVGIFDERHEQIVAGLAGHAAVAIDNARLLRAAQQEVAERRRAEEALRQAHDELEQRVAERTAELAAMNASLEQQVGVRQQAELALQEEREFLKAVLDNIQVGIVACNAEGRLTLFNQVTRELHGLPAEPLPPEQWAEHYDLYYPGGRTRMRPDDVPLKRAFAGERVRDVEMVIAPKDQPPRILLANGQAFYGADGRKRGAVVSMHDVTDQRRAEEEARRRTLELQEVVAELEAFSYSVSHDLRAPLRHIGGYADLLMKRARESLDEKSRRYLETISQAVQRAGHLIDDLLEFSRTSRRDMEHRPVDMQGQVAEVRQELEPEHEGRQVEWTIDPLPPAHGDRAMLWSVWYNLLSNAIKYTGRQQPARIHVGSRREGSEVVYFVRDNGIGFDMRYADKLFGVFQRLHSTNEFEGTGIGLANVRRIVARHGGRTWAESAPGAGATFYFSLPDAAEA